MPGGFSFPANWELTPPRALGAALLALLETQHGDVAKAQVRLWRARFPDMKHVLAWPPWGPMARAMAKGVWHGDVSVRFRRQHSDDLAAPVLPVARLLRYFTGTADVPRLELWVAADNIGQQRAARIPKPYAMDIAIASLDMAARLRSQWHVDKTFAGVSKLIQPRGFHHVADHVSRMQDDFASP